MNFTKPTETKSALLTFHEVSTFLHEFGHSPHGILANTFEHEAVRSTVTVPLVEGALYIKFREKKTDHGSIDATEENHEINSKT